MGTMIETVTRDKTSPVATPVDDGLRAAYHALDEQLQVKMGLGITTLNDIIPLLAQMQKLLSQRGSMSNRAQVREFGYSLESWSSYADRYAAQFGKSLRTIQRHIAVYEFNARAKTERRPTSKINLRPAQQKALVRAQLAANDVIGAWENGEDVDSAVKTYKKVAVSPSALDDFYNNQNAACDVPDCKCSCHGT